MAATQSWRDGGESLKRWSVAPCAGPIPPVLLDAGTVTDIEAWKAGVEEVVAAPCDLDAFHPCCRRSSLAAPLDP